MISKGVWRKIKKGKYIPSNRCLFDSEWLFNKKIDGKIQVTSSFMWVHPNYRSRIYRELLTSCHWRQTMRNTTYVVNQQVQFPYHRRRNSVFICSTRVRNLHEGTIRNVIRTLITLHVQIYIDIRRWYTGNWRKKSIDKYDWMHQEIISDSINGWIIALSRMYDQLWPHQDDSQDLSTRSN